MWPIETAGKNVVMQWGVREAFWDGVKALDLEAPGFESGCSVLTAV